MLFHLVLAVLIFWQPAWRKVTPVQPEIAANIEFLSGDGSNVPGAPQPASKTPPAPDKAADSKPTPPAPKPPQAADGILPAPPAAPPPRPKSEERQDEPAPDVRLQAGGSVSPPPVSILNPLSIISPTAAPGNILPVYPEVSVKRGETGAVTMLLHIRADGTIATIDLLQSSGHAPLDDSAMATALGWKFRPAMHDGHPVASEKQLTVEFLN